MLYRHIVFIISLSVSSLLFLLVSMFIITPKYISNADVMIQVQQDSSNNDSNFDLSMHLD